MSSSNAESHLLGNAVAEQYLAWTQGIPGRQPVVWTRLASNGEDYCYFARHPTQAGIPAELRWPGRLAEADELADLRARIDQIRALAEGR